MSTDQPTSTLAVAPPAVDHEQVDLGGRFVTTGDEQFTVVEEQWPLEPSPAAAEAFAEAAATTTRAQREELQEQMRATLAASLPADPAHDTPVEAFTRAELAKTGRGRGRPSLAGTTGTGGSCARQVRLPSELDQRLSAYTQRADVRASDVMRQAIASYLDAHAPQQHSA